MWVLRRTDINPPGSFPYEQTEGLQHKFEAQSEIKTQAHIVREFRIGNNLARSSLEECYLDIVLYTCERLGRMPKYCYDTEGKSYSPSFSMPSNGGCGGCGARIK